MGRKTAERQRQGRTIEIVLEREKRKSGNLSNTPFGGSGISKTRKGSLTKEQLKKWVPANGKLPKGKRRSPSFDPQS